MKALLLISACCCMAAHAGAQFLTFDRLYPKNPVQELVDGCMQLYAEFDACAAQTNYSPEQQELFVDVVIGKLFRVRVAARKCMHTLHPDDRDYLCNRFKKLFTDYKHLFVGNEHVQNLLRDVVSLLQRHHA